MARGSFLRDNDRRVLELFPADVSPDDLARCFVLSVRDLDLAWARSDAAGRVAAGLQIGAMRLLGFVPDDVVTAPGAVVEFVATQVEAVAEDLAGYSERRQTRWDHAISVEHHVGFRRCGHAELKELDGWLEEQALEHDRPATLFAMACDHLMAESLVRPGVTTIERAVVSARGRAWSETHRRLEPQLTPKCRKRLDGLLVVDDVLGLSRLAWLRRIPSGKTGAQIRDLVEVIDCLDEVGARGFDVSMLNPNRLRHLAALSKRMDARDLARMDSERRYPMLIATVVEALAATTDLVLDLFDTAIGAIDRTARRDLAEQNTAAAIGAIQAVSMFHQVAAVLLDPAIPDERVRSVVWDVVGRQQLAETATVAEEFAARIPGGHLDMVSSQYRKVRKFAPAVLKAFTFHGPAGSAPLLAAIEVLTGLYISGARKLDEDTPTAFVPQRWAKQVWDPDGQLDRYGWEMCVLNELRDGLRGANIWLKHSRKYQDPAKHLLDDLQWQRLRRDHATETGVSLDPSVAIQGFDHQLAEQLKSLDGALDDGTNVRIENDKLVVTPLPAQDEDVVLEQARATVASMLPSIDMVDLLIEVNSWCGFLDEFVHAGNATSRGGDHDARLLATVVANGCNFGTDAMARVGGFDRKELDWTQRWYLRPDVLRAANDKIVNYQVGQPIAELWGSGTLSSSDGQRFPMIATSPRARRMRRYFTGSGATIYTWTSDRHAQYGTRVIPTTVREATHVLDAIFDNETDLEIEEHTTDTAGYTDLIFGLFELTGLTFSPRIRDVADQRLWRLPTTTTTGPSASLLTHKINPARITQRWDDMCRVAATIRHGHEPASILVARLQGSARQNHLTRAIQEYGRLAKTVSILRYLHDEHHRRRIHGQLNKGESIHALRKDIFFANQGEIRRPDPEDQDVIGECLTLITNAVIAWNTTYIAHAIDQISPNIEQRHIARLSPASHTHINFYGRYDFTTPRPPPNGTHRPLRVKHDRNISAI